MKWPDGITSAGVSCGIKTGMPDLGAVVADEPLTWMGVFTTNAAAAAPVGWCRTLLGLPIRAIVVNSGNANACTGLGGLEAVRSTAEAMAAELGCSPQEILVASTGPIGVPLPVDLIEAGIPEAANGLSPEVDDFAHAILTTDTRTKTAEADAGGARVVGVAKGAAMVAPNMATMLAFLATDATVEPDSDLLRRASDQSFGRISIDGCESTNDSVFLLATGAVETQEAALEAAVASVCSSLAQQIVEDAEGATKLLRINVSGAEDESSAVALARAVADSDLWRSAVHGADPNWGRVASALGTVDRGLALADLSISIGDVSVFSQGEPVAEAVAAGAMSGDVVDLHCVVGVGPGEAVFLSCDLSPRYVELNAEGTS